MRKFTVNTIASLALSLIISSPAVAFKAAFSQFDFEVQHQQYQTALSIVGNKEKEVEYLNSLAELDRVNLLAYIGMTDFEDTDVDTLKANKLLAGYLLPLANTHKDDINIKEIENFEAIIMKKVKSVVMGNRYNDQLKKLYPALAQRKPLDFWQSYDLFKNMIAFARKNGSLHTNSPVLEKMQPLADMIAADLNDVAAQVGMAPVKVEITYKRSKAASAWYNIAQDTIYINIADRDLTWTRLTGEIVWHELFHAYQHHLVTQYVHQARNTQIEYYKNAQEDEQYKIWLSAIYNANTIAYQVSENSFTTYNQQPLEKHAHHFGRQVYRSIMNAKF